MFWLQKPVHPVAFYAVRGIEVSVLALMLVAALCGSAALIMIIMGETESTRLALDITPALLLIALWICAMVFAFSAWGMPLDSLFVVIFYFASFMWLAVRMARGEQLERLPWFLPPMDDLRVLIELTRGGSAEGIGTALLMTGRFLLAWTLIGCVGLTLSTRSPVAKDTLR